MAVIQRLAAQAIVLILWVAGSQADAAQASSSHHRASLAKANPKIQAVAAKKRASTKAHIAKTKMVKKQPVVSHRAKQANVTWQNRHSAAKIAASKIVRRVALVKPKRVSVRSLTAKAVKPYRQPLAKKVRVRPQYAVGNYEPAVQASSVLVVDQETGRLIYAKNPRRQTPIASITKLMTALITLEANLPLNEPITITAEDVDRIKHTSSRLQLGTTLTREELLHLALIASENRAAAALSRAYPGGRRAFVAAMNRKARELGMVNTYFVDSTGLSSHNRSTAEDLVKLVQAAYRNPLIRRITTTASYDVKERGLMFVNTNRLVRQSDWEIGISKTGFINEAGYCLVMQARISGRPVIIVLLDSLNKWSRISDAEQIRKWLESRAFKHYVKERVQDVSA